MLFFLECLWLKGLSRVLHIFNLVVYSMFSSIFHEDKGKIRIEHQCNGFIYYLLLYLITVAINIYGTTYLKQKYKHYSFCDLNIFIKKIGKWTLIDFISLQLWHTFWKWERSIWKWEYYKNPLVKHFSNDIQELVKKWMKIIENLDKKD